MSVLSGVWDDGMDIQHVFFFPSKIDSKDHLNRLPAIYSGVETCPRRRVSDQCIMHHASCAVVKIIFASRILPSGQ